MSKKYPFKFLESYQKEDKDFFFGRTAEVESLYKMIFKTKIVIVYGTSGTGKTSLIQCGLANKFNSYDWLSLFVRRGSNLIESLDKELCNHSGGAFKFSQNQPAEIKDLAKKIEAVHKESLRPIYLIFDQFEELYVIGKKAEQDEFVKVIKEILSIQSPIKILISIREEYLGYLYEFEKEVPQLLRRKLRVEPMNFDKVKDVTLGINAYEDSLVKIKSDEIDQITKEIFEKVKGKNKKSLTIQLPYLQVFLDKLYINQTKDHQHEKSALITIDDLNEIGDIGNVMQDFLVQQVKEMEGELKSEYKEINSKSIWRILSDFCTLEGTKEPISKEKLAKEIKSIDKKLINAAVDSFEKHRILRHVDDGDLYELSHDSLALKIMENRSADVVKTLEVKRFITSKAGLTGDLRVLFTEKELIYIEPYLKMMGAKLGKSERNFIKESQAKLKNDKKRKKREEEKKRHRMFWIFGFILIIIFFLGLFLQAAYVKNKIIYDKLVVEEIINSTDSKMKDATNRMITDPTKALMMDKNTMSIFNKIENEEPYVRLKNGSYGWYNKILFPVIKGIYNVDIKQTFKDLETDKVKKRNELKVHGEKLLNENQALYKLISFKEPASVDKFTMSGEKAINLIFPDSANSENFEIWSTDKVMMDSIMKYEKDLVQVVFPLYKSEAIGRDKNGKAGFFRKNRAYSGLKMDSLYKELKIRGPLQVNNIAPIRYEKIGYKLLTAIMGEKIVEWNLNGTIRHNDEEEGKRKSPVIYKKQDIQLGDTVVSITISRRRHKIFTATDQGIGVMWFADTSRVKLGNDKKIAWGLDHKDIVLCSSFSDDGKMILTGSKDHTVALYNADTGKLIKKLKGHTAPVTSVAFSFENKYVFTGSLDGTYRKWVIPEGVISKSPINYSSLKWHNYDSFESIYDIKIKESLDYNLPTVLKKSTGNQ